MRVSWDGALSNRALRLLDMLSYSASGELQRVGSEFDGGYFLPAQALSSCDVISAGIGTDNNFEIQLGNLGMRVLQFDPTIEAPPQHHPMLRFIKEGLGLGQLSLRECILRFEEEFGSSIKNGILKLDIEGSEWEVLEEFADPKQGQDLVRAFSFVVVELHGLTSIYRTDRWTQIEKALSSLLSRYQIVKAIGNNCREIVQIGGVPVIDVIEITLERRTLSSTASLGLSNEIPASNNPTRSPLYSDTLFVKRPCPNCGG